MPGSDKFATGFSAKAANQCKQAVVAAQAATTAGHQGLLGGLWRFDGDQRLGSYQHGQRLHAAIHRLHDHAGQSPPDSSKFYTTATTCNIAGSANPVTRLPDVFTAITTTLTKPRLLPN